MTTTNTTTDVGGEGEDDQEKDEKDTMWQSSVLQGCMRMKNLNKNVLVVIQYSWLISLGFKYVLDVKPVHINLFIL